LILDLARKFSSSDVLKGTGVSNDAQRITGASKSSKQFSVIHALISTAQTTG
jgi:hypothetical protein